MIEIVCIDRRENANHLCISFIHSVMIIARLLSQLHILHSIEQERNVEPSPKTHQTGQVMRKEKGNEKGKREERNAKCRREKTKILLRTRLAQSIRVTWYWKIVYFKSNTLYLSYCPNCLERETARGNRTDKSYKSSPITLLLQAPQGLVFLRPGIESHPERLPDPFPFRIAQVWI